MQVLPKSRDPQADAAVAARKWPQAAAPARPAEQWRIAAQISDPFEEKIMKCPTCPESALVMTDRQGIEIDYCPDCRGLWLDRGELDKLIERAASPAPTRADGTSNGRQPEFVDSDYRPDRTRNPRKSKSWLSDIFD